MEFGKYPQLLFALQVETQFGGKKFTDMHVADELDHIAIRADVPSQSGRSLAVYELKGLKKYDDLLDEAKVTLNRNHPRQVA